MGARGRRGIVGLACTALTLGALGVVSPRSADAVAAPASSTSTLATLLVEGSTSVMASGISSSAVEVVGSVVMAQTTGSRFTLRPARRGGRFTTGQVVPALWVNSWTEQYTPIDAPSVSFTWGGTGCPTYLPTGSLRVDDAVYDGAGNLTSFAAHLRTTCTVSGAVIDTDIRYLSPLPTHALGIAGDIQIGGTSSVPAAGASGVFQLRLLNRGTQAATVGATTLTGVPAGWSATVLPGTCPATLAPKLSCALHVEWTSDGTPATFGVDVATDEQPVPLHVTLHTFSALATPVVTTQSLGDGVLLSWTSPLQNYYTDDWQVFRRTVGGSWVLAGTTSRPTWGDTTMAPGETVDYYVQPQKLLPNAVSSTVVSAVVSGTRAASAVSGDPTIDLATYSTPTMTWGAVGSAVAPALADLPDGPGSYDLQHEVHLGSLYYPDFTFGCGRPTGTIVVRDLARSASVGDPGSIVRLDATLSGRCYDGAAFAGELRVGTAGAAYQRVLTTAATASPEPAWVGVPFTVATGMLNDGATTVALGTPTVRLDGLPGLAVLGDSTCTTSLEPGASCGDSATVTVAAAGTATVAITLPGVGLLGSTALPQIVHVGLDATPPIVTTVPVPRFVDDYAKAITGAIYTDSESGERSEDIRARVASAQATSLSGYLYPRAWQHIDGGVGSLFGVVEIATMSPGVEYCISYRARDAAGNVSSWTPDQCRTRVWDDPVLRPAAGRWTRGSSWFYNANTWVRATAKGARLVGPTVNARRIAVLAATCSTCGTADVYVGSTKVGSLNLHSRRSAYRVMLQLPPRFAPVTGRLSIVVTSSGKPVVIDGIGGSLT